MAKPKPGYVDIRGTQYETVAHRIGRFRETYPISDGWGIETALDTAEEKVLARAWIVNPEGKTVAVGHSEEFRGSSAVNKTSASENAETSAIGRCLSAAGFLGSEFASADEMQAAISQPPTSNKAAQSKPAEPTAEEKEKALIAKIEAREQHGGEQGLIAIWSWAKNNGRATPAVQCAAAGKLAEFVKAAEEADRPALLEWAASAFHDCRDAQKVVAGWTEVPF